MKEWARSMSVGVARCEDSSGQKQLVAYVVSEGEPEVSSTELRSYLKEQTAGIHGAGVLSWL
jgi:hypothetical protein